MGRITAGAGGVERRGGRGGVRLARAGWGVGLGAALAVGAVPAEVGAQVAVRADTVHTVAGDPLPDGVVLIGADGRIERVGPASEVPVPEGWRVVEGRAATPGLVDGHSVVGLAGWLNAAHDQDQLDRERPIQPALRAFDAYNAREPLVEWLRGFGVTTVHTGHGPGALVSGQTMVVKTRGETVGEAIVDSVAMVAMTFGRDVTRNFAERAGTRSKGVAMLRQALIDAQEYRRKRAETDEGEGPARSLEKEVLVRVLDGELPALVTAQQVSEILAALRLAEEFDLRLVLDGAAEAWMVLDEIRAAGVPVLLHPTMARQAGSLENATFETAARLREAGIPFALQSGYESYVPKTRVVLFEAAVATAYGLAPRDALAAVTLDAARILGLEDRIGSIEVGKDGDVVVYDGPPFEYTTRVCAVVIEGEMVSEECR